MLKLGTLTAATLVLAASPLHALSTYEQESYLEWKQSVYYSAAKKFVAIAATSASGSGSVAVGDVETWSSSSNSSSGGVTTTTSSWGNSTTTTTTTTVLTSTDEETRFAQALANIEALKVQHPHANFSVNSPFVLLTADEFLAYVNRYGVDPNAAPIRTSSTSSSNSKGDMFTTAAESTSGSTTFTGSDGAPMTLAAEDGESIDWETAGCVTPVKDQGECGACWAFSATAAIESGYCVATNGATLPSLADQELISCDDSGESQGCGGGFTGYTIDWVANERSGKMCSLASYPFASINGDVPSCALSGCDEVSLGVTGYETIREDAGALEDAVRARPVSVFLYSGSTAFQYYSGGILSGDNCAKTGSHSALAVGFGTTDDGVKYWRIKNQWGTDWGESGYVRVERRYSGDSEGACGVELYAVYPTFDGSQTAVSPAATTTAAPTSAPATAAPATTTAAPAIATSAPLEATPSPATTEAPATTSAAPVATKAAQEDVTDAPASTAVAQTPSDDVGGEANSAATTTAPRPKDCKM